MSCSSKKRFGRIVTAIVLGGVLGAFSTTPPAFAVDEAPIVGPPSERLTPTDVAAGPPPITRLSPPVPPDFLRSPCQTAGGSGCGGTLIAPPPPAPGGFVDRVLPAPPIVLP
jgi:hypothetical protein